MEQPETEIASNSSSFEDLTKEDVKDAEASDGFMDILGNQQLTKKVGQILLRNFSCKLLNLCFRCL